MSGFSSAKANTEFELKFTAPASLLLGVAEPIANKTAVYVQLGANLAAARRAIENLSGEDAHNPGPGGALADDVWTEAIATMTKLWDQHNPQEVVPGPEPSSQGLRKQWNNNVKKSYETAFAAMTRGAAADRAAAATMAAPPGLPRPMTASISTPGKIGATEEVDAIDIMLGRMGDNQAPLAQDGSQDGLLRLTGNGQGAVAICATAVPPELVQKCHRLVAVGVPPLRKKRQGAILASMMLGSKNTFSDWVDMYEHKLKMTGHLLREAQTIGRALDLDVHQLGPGYLGTDGAEILLRRLLCLVTAAKHGGSFKIASKFEELPADDAISEIPEDLLTEVYARIKLEERLEGLRNKQTRRGTPTSWEIARGISTRCRSCPSLPAI